MAVTMCLQGNAASVCDGGSGRDQANRDCGVRVGVEEEVEP